MRSHNFNLLISVLLMFSVGQGLAGETAEPAPGNATCPVMVGEKIDPAISTTYQGRKVYFCCQLCRHSFLKDPEKYLGNLPPEPQVSAVRPGAEPGHHEKESAETAQAPPHQDRERGHGADTDHDHARHGTAKGWERSIRFIGKFHPLAVHFPIALVMAAALAEILFLLTRKAWFGEASRFCLAGGAVTILIATALGWAAGAFARYPGVEVLKIEVLTLHRWLGTTSAALVVLAATLSELHRRGNTGPLKTWHRILLAVAVVAVGLTGYFGGILIYGLDHYRW